MDCIKIVVPTNMCPCGHFPDLSRCICTEYARKRYMARISQPILDRMDVQILIQPVRYEELYQESPEREVQDSICVRGLVARTHEIQHKRYQNENILFNSQLEGRLLEHYCELDGECRNVLQRAYDRLGLSARAGKRVLRVARTIADMEEEVCIKSEHLLEALSYREMEGLSR